MCRKWILFSQYGFESVPVAISAIIIARVLLKDRPASLEGQ
jgi:hypothetical protein